MVVLTGLGQVSVVLGEVSRDGRIGDGHARELSRSTGESENSATVAVLGSDAVSADHTLRDGGIVSGAVGVICAADGVDAAPGRAIPFGGIAGDDAIGQIEAIRVDTAAVSTAITAGFVVSDDLVAVDGGMNECQSSPNGDASSARESVRLGG